MTAMRSVKGPDLRTGKIKTCDQQDSGIAPGGTKCIARCKAGNCDCDSTKMESAKILKSAGSGGPVIVSTEVPSGCYSIKRVDR